MVKNDFKLLSDREHIVLRPEMYIGSINFEDQEDFNFDNDHIKYENFKIIPGLCKIINEVIDNSIDEAIKTNFKYGNEISIIIEKDKVQVQDNGRGIPVVKQGEFYQPYLCWGRAKAGSNFSEDDNHIQIGKFGVGSYCTNVWSEKFIGETDDGKNYYKVTFKNNAELFTESISKSKSQGTTVTFYPDLKRFNITEIDENHVNYIYQRILCLANIFDKIKFKFNKKLIRVKNFKEFAKLFNENFEIYETDDVKIAIMPNDSDDFKHFTYVNGLKIKDGGIHVDTIIKNVVNIIRDKISKKYKNIKPGDIRNKLMLVSFIKNFPSPKFNSQTKEKLTNSEAEFNKFSNIDYSFVNKILKNNAFIDPIVEIYKIKEEFENRKALKGVEKVKKIKSDNFFKSVKSNKYFSICEGFSALSGVSKILGNQDWSYFSLKGKPLNTWEVSHQKFAANKELSELYQIIKGENFENIVITSDSDIDGAHIASLLVTFFEKYLPDFKDRIYRLNTPIKANKKNGKLTSWVYDLNDELPIKPGETQSYYKGLGSWNVDDLDQVIQKDGLEKMLVKFKFDSKEIIDDFMSNKKSDARKDYILNNNFSIVKI